LLQQVEQQGASSLAERQVTQFVQDDRVHAHQVRRDPPSLAFGLLAFQRVDQVHRRVERHPLAMPEVRLSCAARLEFTPKAVPAYNKPSTLPAW
jgi:hypothetical protein